MRIKRTGLEKIAKRGLEKLEEWYKVHPPKSKRRKSTLTTLSTNEVKGSSKEVNPYKHSIDIGMFKKI